MVEKREYKIEVTEQDIAKATPKNSSICAVARAVARNVQDAVRITVDTQAIRLTRGGHRYVYLTPPMVQKYVVDFDAGRPIEPFDFRLRVRDLLPVQQATLTPEGRDAERLSMQAGRKAEREAKVAGQDPVVARKRARRAIRAAVRAKQSGPPKKTTPGRRAAPPKVFRKKERSYGHRLLAINKANVPIVVSTEPAPAF